MGKRKAAKIGITDIAAAWKAGWTPADVNAMLDRLEEVGDINDPPEADDEDLNDEVLNEEDNEIDNPEDEDQDESDEDVEDNASDEDEKENTTSKKKNSDSLALLEAENKRLNKQIEKLQAKNRTKDVSGDNNSKSMEQSLIDTFNELF